MPRRPPSRLKWFTLRAHDGGRWAVYLCEVVTLNGRQRAGLTDYERGELLICAAETPAETLYTLMHELMHAASPDEAVPIEHEEKFILATERNLWNLLAQMGLRAPDLPRGYDALRRRALARVHRGAA